MQGNRTGGAVMIKGHIILDGPGLFQGRDLKLVSGDHSKEICRCSEIIALSS